MVIVLYSHHEDRLAVAPPVAGAYTRVNNHVADAHILHKCGRIVAHEADAAVALLDDTVRDDHVADMAVTVADDNCLRAGTQHAVRDDDVLARFCPIRNAGKRNAVVAARNIAISNNNTFTACNMDAVVVQHVEAGVNRKAKQLYITDIFGVTDILNQFQV